MSRNRNTPIRTYLVLLLFILLRGFGNLSLAWGMKNAPEQVAADPLTYLAVMIHPFVALGVAMLILAMFARLALLSLADLSFVLPVTAVGYVVAAALGKFFLHEEVTPERWLGTLLIFAGIALVGSTPPKTVAKVVIE